MKRTAFVGLTMAFLFLLLCASAQHSPSLALQRLESGNPEFASALPKASMLDMLNTTFETYTNSRQQIDLFLHLDKNVYTHNENIWFTGYILNKASIVKQHTLYTLLVEEDTKNIRASERFVINSVLAGGALFLPDSLPSGRYRLIAYTNSFHSHPSQAVFQQPITLKADNRRSNQPPAVTVPSLQQEAVISFFPEGGAPVHNQKGSLGLEIKTREGKPVTATGQLLENGKSVTDFSTDQAGLGFVSWRPSHAKSYTISLSDSFLKLSYRFPEIQKEGFFLHVPQAVVTGKNFVVEIGGTDRDTCHLLVHNYRNTFFLGSLLLTNRRSEIRLMTNEMPDGVVTLTLFNAAGEPQAERAVYIRKEEPLRVQINSNALKYRPRSRVELEVKISDSKGNPVQGRFSLACVLASRLDTTYMPDIERYVHFDRFLPSPAVLPAGYSLSRENIERLLLTRFWTKYKWQEVEAAKGNVPQLEKKCMAGYLYYRGRPVAEPMELTVVSAAGANTIRTDAMGYFVLPDQALLAKADEKPVMLPAAGKGQSRYYEVKWVNHCRGIEDTLAQTDYPQAGYAETVWLEQEHESFRQTLAAVTVTAQRQDDLISTDAKAPVFKSATCNDWVCMYKVLNCTVHPVGSVPQSGEQYYFQNKLIIYRGCESEEDNGPEFLLQRVNGIYFPKQFYNTDYSIYKPDEPETMPTLYWSYEILTDEKGKAYVEFYTNDLLGKFICVIQGYSADSQPFSGRMAFRVAE